MFICEMEPVSYPSKPNNFMIRFLVPFGFNYLLTKKIYDTIYSKHDEPVAMVVSKAIYFVTSE